jgi:glycyl-tRNA synthetase beta chain
LPCGQLLPLYFAAGNAPPSRSGDAVTGTKSLLVELFVEELPPKSLKKLGDAFGSARRQPEGPGLAAADATATTFASPRRLAVHTDARARRAPPTSRCSRSSCRSAVGLDAQGQATPVLLKKLAALGADASVVPKLKRAVDGKAETLFLDKVEPGIDARRPACRRRSTKRSPSCRSRR